MKAKGWILAIAMGFAFTTSIHAQDPTWNQLQIKDPLTGKVVDRFSLDGVYLATPYGTSVQNQDTPKLVLMCSNGKLVKQYGLTRAFIQPTVISSSLSAKLDMVIDGGKKKTVSTDVDTTQDRVLSDDDTQRQYRIFELGNVLTDIVRGKTITMVVREDRGGSTSITSAAPRQILMEFRMPSLTPVLAICGADRVFRGITP